MTRLNTFYVDDVGHVVLADNAQRMVDGLQAEIVALESSEQAGQAQHVIRVRELEGARKVIADLQIKILQLKGFA